MFSGSRLIRVLRYPDFRLLWIGAFLSFTGSWIQNIAEGYYVFHITGDESKLAFVSFARNLPVLVLGLFAGSFSDQFNKRTVLIWTQVIFAVCGIYLAAATYSGFITYLQILFIAFLTGIVSSIEMPTRQSIVSRVVPIEELSAAVPVNAMTFNVARIFGPALGGLVLTWMGVAMCYLLNGLSFMALVWSAFMIKSDLGSGQTERSAIKDLVFEGALYTLRDVRLRTLFFLEILTAVFGLAYLPMLPAYIPEVLHLTSQSQQKTGLATAYTAVGIGALFGLLLVTQLADSERKGAIVQGSMLTMGIGLLVLSVVRIPLLGYIDLGVVGMAAIMQLNTTNALFQILAPDRLRGRVLSMHIWALNGLAPFGVLFFGWLAKLTKGNVVPSMVLPTGGVPLSLAVGSLAMTIGGLAALLSKKGLSNLTPNT